MRIEGIEIFYLGVPLARPMVTPLGTWQQLQTVLVALESGGLRGWGEASPGNAPLLGPEWAGGVYRCLCEWIGPAVVGQSLDTAEQLQQRLARLQGNRYAKAAVDCAWWDLAARLQGKPLHQLLGGQTDRIALGVSFDKMPDIQDLLEAMRRAFEAGYSSVELKFRPGWEVSMVHMVRQEFPTEQIHIDVEGDLRLSHMEMLCRLDDFMLAMIEQPLPPYDLVGHAMIQDAIRTPICLAESITCPEEADIAIELKSGRYINLEPGRVGGLTPAQQIHDACRTADIGCRLGARPQTSIGTALGLALGTKDNFSYPADFFPPEDFLADELTEPIPLERSSDGKLQAVLSTQPGIGRQPDPQKLHAWTLEHTRLVANTR
ncbi:MAG: o-succinylbenzoate synthase [Thermoguttaceae bacterium]|nr:o-succinylbenzoate synthase [Thermoguttaceae bacterium]MDW8037138.1 o-succinylbenzoate synthase [Thermoguttaceae bacterium]